MLTAQVQAKEKHITKLMIAVDALNTDSHTKLSAIRQCGVEITGLRHRVRDLVEETKGLKSQLQLLEAASGDPAVLRESDDDDDAPAYGEPDDDARGEGQRRKQRKGKGKRGKK